MRRNALLILAGTLSMTAAASAAPTNLLQDSAVRSSGSYTYYARGDANATEIPALKTPFYPGAPLHGNSPGDADKDKLSATTYATQTDAVAGPISLQYGLLADNKVATRVSGWVDVERMPTGGDAASTHNGTIDILFDLGATYKLSSVAFNYTDSLGHRYNASGNAQAVFYSNVTNGSPSESDFLSFGTGTTTRDQTEATLTLNAAAGSNILARYVIIRLNVTVGKDAAQGSLGGYLNEVYINGEPSPVPEPSALALLSFGAAGLMMRRR